MLMSSHVAVKDLVGWRERSLHVRRAITILPAICLAGAASFNKPLGQ
jgi:hypothetical protein